MQIQRDLQFEGMLHQSYLEISFSGYVQTDEDWHQKPLPSPYSRLYYVTEGSGVLLSENSKMELEPGYVYLAPCGSPCGFYGTDSVTKLFFHMRVQLPNGYDLFAAAGRFARIPFPVERIQTLLDWYFSKDIVKHTMLKCALWEIVAAFAGELEIAAEGQMVYSPVVQKAIMYIRSNLRADLAVQDVADALYCSVGSLSYSFRQDMGVTMARYIEDLVMQEAQRLLQDSDKTIGQISSELGFCDQFYFTRRFSRRYRITPREYRKNCAKF